MIITDYFRYPKDSTWDIARQCGVEHGVIRLPETDDFDVTNFSHWQKVHKDFCDFGLKPLIIEPMPNNLHDHIKIGDEKRDECIEKVIKMFPIMEKLGMESICFNWMAYIGWLRTSDKYVERGGATVSEFDMGDFKPISDKITAKKLWDNYSYFIKAVIPYAENHGIKLALHPDDPPVKSLGNVERIMITKENIKKAIYDIVKSDNLGLTFCQANFFVMGEDLEKTIKELSEKIFFIHFRNVKGNPLKLRETFHDNGDIDMANIMKIYKQNGINVPIRVDHVPTLVGEKSNVAGYDALGRLFAIGYLKGILDSNK